MTVLDHLRRRLVVPALVAATGLTSAAPTPASANLASEMEQMFNAMAVATPPAAFDTGRRGVLSGGGVSMRNRIVNESIASFVPPSIEAGCGGIDFFAGSFSFINAEQFTQLMRAVAMNAAGYAFNIALRSMCPDCMSTIETLQRKIQEMNQFFSNSCQMAQGIVADGARALGRQVETEASLINTIAGVGDVFESWTTTTGTAPIRQATNAVPERVEQRIQGNLVWRALRRQGAQNWFVTGDMELLEIMMNVTGTVIVGDVAPYEGGGGENLAIRVLAPKTHLLATLVSGGTATIEGCSDYGENQCRNLVTKTIDVTGFEQRIITALLGSPTSRGIVAKIATNEAPSTLEQQTLAMLPSGLGGLIVRLSSYSQDAGRILVERSAPQLALEMARVVMVSLVDGTAAAVAATEHPHIRQVQDQLGQARFQVAQEALQLQTRYGSLIETVRAYQDLMNVVGSAQLNRPSATPASN
ncbi:conjugal transfer protein TraH [Pseudoroseomonas sp. WGS1072]|uniref:conjugal transfer protein TraH n=1 Tax=Roseomonas sp. WGS1072 TaxID=3366816 RepID=UPI003BF42051